MNGLPMGDGNDEMDGDEEERAWRDYMADLREDDRDRDDEENDDDDDEEDESDDDDEEDEEEEEEVHDENVDKLIRTFYNGDYDNRFDEALSFDRSVIPPVRPTQASYNKPDNWREINRLGLMTLQEQLQTCINNVTHDNMFNLVLRHNRQDNDAHIPIVWHEPFSIVNDYWDELEKAIDRKKHATDIRGIHIQNVELKNFRLAMIVDICRRGGATNSSTMFSFENANLCADGIMCLSKLIEISLELREFRLFRNWIDNMESASCLSRSLKSHACINYLHLTHCDLGSNPEILSVILQSDVKYINLASNNIDSLGAVKIAEYLEGHPPIHRIDLDHNRLNDDDAILISQALQTNMNLETLYIQSNNFTSIGVKAFLTCVFDSSSLNAISESNHTLIGMYIFWRGNNKKNDRLHDCIDRLLRMDRKEKILLALRDKESLLQYLANVPVELIPDVLAFPLRLIDDEHQYEHLNIVYSTMRWWNMPLLYSYYDCVKSDKRKRDD
jgi:hypothetical protein